jgi:hypothetical protein
MSVLANGTEDLPPGLTPAAAYALVNTAIQKIAQMNLLDKDVPFFGLIRDGQIRGTSQIAIERLITAVEIRAESAVPVGSALVVQLVVNGNLMSQQYTLAAGNSYALVAVINDGNGGGSGSGLVVPATQTIGVQMINGNQAADVVVTLKTQLRIL